MDGSVEVEEKRCCGNLLIPSRPERARPPDIGGSQLWSPGQIHRPHNQHGRHEEMMHGSVGDAGAR